jgi:hypothetical protein
MLATETAAKQLPTDKINNRNMGDDTKMRPTAVSNSARCAIFTSDIALLLNASLYRNLFAKGYPGITKGQFNKVYIKLNDATKAISGSVICWNVVWTD